MGIKEEVAKLVGSSSAKHKRLIEYVTRQLNQGRKLDEVLEDPYVTNRLNIVERRALIEEPEIVEAVSDEVLHELQRRLEEVAGR
ncbi:MAG: hypothetical protein MUE51_15335 [Thermoleophilia bacterium]|jgi:hypothetical protein|nr:hypothetical protein [Thermoleophilia bacterium]